jgi:hypothetical protein
VPSDPPATHSVTKGPDTKQMEVDQTEGFEDPLAELEEWLKSGAVEIIG